MFFSPKNRILRTIFSDNRIFLNQNQKNRPAKPQELCPSRANAPQNRENFAQTGQTSCKTARALPKLGKRPAKPRELCPSRANTLRNREGFAQAGQTSCKTARNINELEISILQEIFVYLVQEY
jgi:hypothetical protein